MKLKIVCQSIYILNYFDLYVPFSLCYSKDKTIFLKIEQKKFEMFFEGITSNGYVGVLLNIAALFAFKTNTQH